MKNPLVPLLALLTAVTVFAKPPADLQKKLDDFVKGGPGGVAVAWVDADGAAFFSSGTMAAADPRAITPDTEFELGSLTKVFTALLLAESERAGKVSRLDPAAKYLLPATDPDQAALAKITLLSLTTHTSGLPRLPSNFTTATAPDPYATYDDAMLIAALRSDGPSAPTGRRVAYSNFGAAVLGESLAKAWGTTYTEALTAHVLTPLGMKATSLGLAGTPPPPEFAPGHANGQQVPAWTWLACAPLGAVRSSAHDMARFLAAALGQGERPLAAAFDATLQPQFPSGDTGGHIGLAWFLTDDAENPVAWHNGATAGSHTFVAFSRKTGSAIAILSNIQRGSESLGFALLGAKPPGPKGETIKNASDYTGHYLLTTAIFNVIEVNGTLRLKVGETPSLGLHLVSPDRFALAEAPVELSFERDSAGKVVAVVLHQNGMDQRAPRGDPPALPKEIILPAETLHEYPGHYPLAPSFVLTVTEENGLLQVQATGQGRLAVYASAKDEFFYKSVPARISFQRDASGKVIGLTLHQGGRDMLAPKSAGGQP